LLALLHALRDQYRPDPRVEGLETLLEFAALYPLSRAADLRCSEQALPWSPRALAGVCGMARSQRAHRRVQRGVAGRYLTGHMLQERKHTRTLRESPALRFFQGISDGQKRGQREFKPWQ
jgi:hypothetical protein